MTVGPLKISLRQPMLGGPGVEAYIAEAPAKPFVAIEDHLGFAKSQKRLLALAAARVVLAQVDQGIRLRFDDPVLPGDLNALPVVGDRLVDVSEFTVNPADAVGHSREDDAVAVAPGHLQRLVQSLKRLRHPPLVTQSEPEEEAALKQREPVAQFRR